MVCLFSSPYDKFSLESLSDTCRLLLSPTFVFMKELQYRTHQHDQWVWSEWPTGHIYGCGRLIRNHFPGLERQALRTAAGQHWTLFHGSNRWQLVTDSDTAIGLKRPIYLMGSLRGGDSQYFFTWTLVDDSARAKMIHFITASLIGEANPDRVCYKTLEECLKVTFVS